MNQINKFPLIFCLFVFFLSLLLISNNSLAETTPIDWNNKNIKWQEYKKGLAKAKRMNKPALIIFYADWCPTCKSYGKVFKDKRVVRAASDFIMIRINTEKHSKLSKTYEFDGSYVPRTFAIYPNGKIMHKIYSPDKYKYYIGVDPNSLLSLMQQALSNI